MLTIISYLRYINSAGRSEKSGYNYFYQQVTMEVSLKRALKLLGASVVSLLVILFSVPFLNNIHNAYIRILGSGVVMLTNSAGNSGATGFVVRGKSGKKYIMTNNHVCGLAENGLLRAITVGGESFEVSKVKSYEYNDLCALEAHQSLGLAVNIARSVDLGESAWVIGHPLLEPRSVAVGELSGTVFITIAVSANPKGLECMGPTYSIVDTSNTSYHLFGVDTVCTRRLEAVASTMSIQPGNSGSPAVNIYGSVIAVAFAANESGTRSYFVPLSDLKNFLGEL